MAIQIKTTKRIFKITHNGKSVSLPDPNPEMNPDEVSEFYSGTYPQLLNSSYERKQENDNLVFTFKTIAGTKG